MVRYGAALAVLLSASASSVYSFSNFEPSSRNLARPTTCQWQRQVAARSSEYDSNNNNNKSVGDAVDAITTAARDSIKAVVAVDEPDLYEAGIALKKKLVQERSKTYTVTLPLSKAAATSSSILSMGVTIRQINKGRVLSPDELVLDTLSIQRAARVEIDTDTEKVKDEETIDRFDFDLPSLARKVKGNFHGTVVSSVSKKSAAWAAGVRAGDILKSTSATLGDAVWPKSTLEGVRSAISSRRATSGSIQLGFERVSQVIDNQFELTLTRPIGIELQGKCFVNQGGSFLWFVLCGSPYCFFSLCLETEDGFVQVTGFTENAPTLVQYAVKVGDRVLAIDSSFGDRMWPVSTVAGVISAVTSRLPGQQITMRLQRPAANMVDDNDTTTPVALSSAKAAASTKEMTSKTTTSNRTVQVDQKELLKRCRDILKRYMSEEQQQVRSKFVEKYSVPAMVADKVMDALASAEATVDNVTLSMIMGAYLSCRQAEGAIAAFESVTGLNANGSSSQPTPTLATQQQQDNKQIVPNADAFNAFTASALLKAHAVNGDLASVQRVLAALEGKCGKEVRGLSVASWPGTGREGVIRPDTRCYNIAISAAAESCLDDGLTVALDMFDRMSLPTTVNGGDTPEPDLVTYNTVINAFTQFGKYKEAIAFFYDMKKAGVKPDKYSYTALVKAVVVHDEDGEEFFDVQELLYDMKEEGVQADAVTYNTIIKAMCQERKIVAAKKMVNQMEAAGVSPDSITYGLLMTALLKSGNPSACVTLFESACADRRTVALTENVHLYTTAITAASALGDHDRALDLLTRMSSIGVKPNIKTLTALVGACLSSGKPDLAVEIYKRIDNPDGYATLQGLRAFSESGNIEEGLSIVNKGRRSLGVTGKQLMMMYETMISNALQQSDYDMARRVLTHLLQKRNIPSKHLFQTMFSSMKIFAKQRKAFITIEDVDEEADAKFSFLLFVLDSVQQRNLPCEGSLYTAILLYGARLGSLPRKISALMAYARMASEMEVPATVAETPPSTLPPVISWEAAFNKYDELKQQLRDPVALPSLNVRIAASDRTRVLAAEQSLSYSGERNPRRQEV